MLARLAGAGLCLALQWGCAHRPQEDSSTYNFSHTFAAMGTSWTVQASFEDAPSRERSLALSEELSQIVFDHEMALSDWIEDSELRRAEKRGLTRWQKASPTLFKVMELSDMAHDMSGVAFDPSVGAVLWKKSRKAAGWQVELNASNQEFRFKRDPVRLSFGGIAKGFSVGALARTLIGSGARALTVNAGGGNYAFWGWGSPESCATGKICFLSHSRIKQPDNKADHIISTKKRDESRPSQLRLQCEHNTSDNLVEAGALNDALSTALVLREFSLPAHCTVL